MLEEKREKFQSISEKVGWFFSKSKIHPNLFTIFSVVFGLISFIFLFKNNLSLGILFFLLAAFSDFVDGAVAKFTSKTTIVGAYLDTICDRYVEVMVLLGLLFLPLPEVFLPASVWIFLALFGSLMTTYAKAAAKEKEMIEKELKKGLFGRPERLIVIFLAMVSFIFNPYWSIYILIILAVFSNFTAFQRIFFALNLRKRS
jgi:phosphatidylglycerophosphate synthase